MNNIKIGIASDHRGFTAKEFLKEYFDENDIYVIDFGTNSAESVDFPVYAKKLGEAIQNEEIDLGIAICGTGIGMSIVLNKMKVYTVLKYLMRVKLFYVEEVLVSSIGGNGLTLAIRN